MKRSTVFAVIILLFFGLGAYLLTKQPTLEEDSSVSTPEPTPYLLVNLDENSISRLEITAQNGSVTIGRDEQNLWQLLQPVNPAIDLGTLEMRITDLLNLRAKQIIAAKLTDEEIGLDSPTLTAKITTKDGTQRTYRVGSQNPIGTGYYARGSDQQVVLLNIVAVENVLHLIESSYATATPTLEPLNTTTPLPN